MLHTHQHMRFKPDPMDAAMVDLKASTPAFEPTMSCLILNESFSGCALVIPTAFPISEGTFMRVKVGRMEPLRAEVVWTQRLDDELLKVGIRFLE